MFNFQQLTTGLTLEQAEEELREIAEAQGINTQGWRVGSPEYTMLKMLALFYSEQTQRVAQASLNQINQFASGAALTYLADSHFANSRIQASAAIGNMIVTGSSQFVPRTFQPTEFKVTDGTYIFYNLNQFTISNAVPYVTESFMAEANGTDYNIPANSTLTTVETNIGFTVTNPANSGSSTWITQFGGDEESDRALQLRNALKYSSLQTGDLTIDRVKYLALSASIANTYVAVDDSNPRGAGTANIYLSADTSTATSASVAAAQLAMNQAFFGNLNGDLVTCYAASASYFSRPITVYYKASVINPTSLITTVKQEADNWIASIPIGGNNYLPLANNIASITDLIRDLENVTNVAKVRLSDTSDISLQKNEKLVSPTNWDNLISFVKLNNINI
jgi:hypothetical protein